MTRRLLAIVMALVAFAACTPRYTLNGASIDYSKYKTVSFSDFPIRAALVYPPLEQMFSNKMIDMVTRQTRLRVIDNPNSDVRIEGEITGYSLSPQAVGEDAYATKTRLTITVRVKYIDNVDPRKSNDRLSFSAYRDFSSDDLLTDVQDELCSQICDDLTDLIFNQTFGNW